MDYNGRGTVHRGIDREEKQTIKANCSGWLRNYISLSSHYDLNTYKIENKVCYVSYNGGISWETVPVSVETLAAVGDGRPYFNKLQEKSYVITSEKTAFVYGGTKGIPLTATYSEDKGTTWKTSQISKTLDSVRVKFCSFPNAKVGYVIATGDRAMSQESQIIYI
ncbi:hypothetical protein [Desulfosporosinus hippei]|uniref:BNR/Asp-box repeat-containing protein n=1 Tax=Desulfosporosinus hippei DSM 8344 TaxID=1121419 RepID=A0A1G7ZTU1_9FIRM|nr:hypothetical protein [Desulfosporosinus hippei]SDH12125.1 hypothetical protein SAMN05443529_1105 [Desulfosporosinus hippei DSM 8344]